MSIRNGSAFGASSAELARPASATDNNNNNRLEAVETPTQPSTITSYEMPFPLIEASLLITFFATLALVVNLYLLNVWFKIEIY